VKTDGGLGSPSSKYQVMSTSYFPRKSGSIDHDTIRNPSGQSKDKVRHRHILKDQLASTPLNRFWPFLGRSLIQVKFWAAFREDERINRCLFRFVAER
jgi:hypothetical protein